MVKDDKKIKVDKYLTTGTNKFFFITLNFFNKINGQR